MSGHGPDFDELVGSELTAAERERLRRVHDLLVAAGPPPDLAPLPAPPATVRTRFEPRRRGSLLALAATLAAIVFALGYVTGDTGGPNVDFDVTMTGTPSAAGASAKLDIFEIDQAGNWPMELSVDGLEPTASGRPYELWLTKGGKLAALCGSFLAEPDGTTVVPMNAPYRLRDFDGWVVVEEGSEAPLLTT